MGWAQAKEPASQCARVCQNYPLANYQNADTKTRKMRMTGFNVQGPLNGGVSNGGASRSGLVLPFLSFFVLFGTFPIFPGFSRFARGWSGDFPDSSFSSFSAYEEHLRGTVLKGSATQSVDLSRKKWETLP